jgi:hypothetical protein
MDPRKYGPTRGELLFRFCVSLGLIALLGAAFVVQGLPRGLAMVELLLFIGAFAGGTALWALRRLILRLHP